MVLLGLEDGAIEGRDWEEGGGGGLSRDLFMYRGAQHIKKWINTHVSVIMTAKCITNQRRS